tara:strand:- start:3516 stop:3644 length:129 start_codon:yes stop_codon:yes gene_type:complete
MFALGFIKGAILGVSLGLMSGLMAKKICNNKNQMSKNNVNKK